MICRTETEAGNSPISCFSYSSERPAVLVSEDHDDVLMAIGLLLKNNGFDCEFSKSPAEALAALRSRAFDAVLLDLNYSRDTTSGTEGLELLANIQATNREVPIVVMTAWGTIELAVEAMHHGASDFIQKPWDNRHLLEVLNRQIDRARKQRASRISEELELEEAAQIQRALLPAQLAAPRGMTISAATQSLGNVSGDYYDVIPLDSDRSAICIADVMGKGMGAALLMSHLRATIRMLAPQISDPSELCRRLNESVSLNDLPGKFISLFFCIVDTEKMRITYTNAGHNWPILVRKDGSHDRLRTEDAVLGTLPHWKYRQREQNLQSGDRLVLFTDGITECFDPAGAEFGEEQLSQLVAANVHLSAEQLQQLIIESVKSHSGIRFNDDATLIVSAIA